MGARDAFPTASKAKAGVAPATLAERRRQTSRPLTQVDVEDEILRFMEMLEEATDELAGRARAAAEAEVNYKGLWAQTVLSAEGTELVRKSTADVACHKLLMERRTCEAMYASTKELCGALQAQLSALQTISSNLRSQV